MKFPAIWWRLNTSLPQQGPGSEASTLRALDALGVLPERPHILDMGCGPGRQTLSLARATGGTIVALDLLLPFLRELCVRTRVAGVDHRVHPVCADMRKPSVATGRFDLLWSEGAIYISGFEESLASWRELLRPGGAAAVTELSWIAKPPEATRSYWEAAYPAITDVDSNRARAERAGYEVLSTFTLPIEDWYAYYDPMETRAASLRPEYADDPNSLAILAGHHEEIRVLEESENSYGYVFYLLRRSA